MRPEQGLFFRVKQTICRNGASHAPISYAPPPLSRIYDVTVGKGPEAVEGKRVVVHFEAKWRGVTFITTRWGRPEAGLRGLLLHALDSPTAAAGPHRRPPRWRLMGTAASCRSADPLQLP